MRGEDAGVMGVKRGTHGDRAGLLWVVGRRGASRGGVCRRLGWLGDWLVVPSIRTMVD